VITVFDVATEEELIDMFGFGDEEYDRELMIEFVETDPDFNYRKLAVLYFDRGDTKKSDEYLALIKDDQYREETDMFIHELID
jgi:hypothetical protein